MTERGGMSVDKAYELICKEIGRNPIIKLCKDFGDFYAFFFVEKPSDKFVGSVMTAIDKKTKKIFPYYLNSSIGDYSRAKTVVYKK